MKVTACIITWKRQHNIPRIVENLLRYDFIDEILIRDNSKTDNVINWGRYLLARQAKNDIVFYQDDDQLPDIAPLYEAFLKDPTKLCHTGPEAYKEGIEKHTYGSAQMALVGWGTLLNREWIPILDLYLDKYGYDYCFYRETDRIFSILQNEPHNFVDTVITPLNDRDSVALSAMDEHITYKNLAIKRALELL